VLSDPLDDAAEPARRTVALLESQAADLRAELLKLHRDVAQVRRDFSGMHAAQLLEANEQLVVAALHAETIAETAAGNLSEMTRRGQYDPLTETPNRLLMFDRMSSAIALAHRRGTRLAVLFVDLDHFKQINDMHGHAAGDQVLKLAVRRLQSAIRDSDTVSRHGGDEFLVLLPEIGHASDAGISASKMLSALSAEGRLGEALIELNASIGIATFPEDGGDASTLIAAADAAMYRAKQRGRGTFEFHDAAPIVDNSPHPLAGGMPEVTRLHDEIAAGQSELVFRDLREANEQLLLAALAARDEQVKGEAKQRRQAGLLAIMAHELRNPLAPIRTAAGLLRNPIRDKPLIARFQGIIESQVDSMSRLLDDLIEGSDARTSQTRLERRPAELADILRMAAEMCRLAMDSRHQRFSLDLPAGALIVYADVSRLVQVFCNLLDNASKYTPAHGRITLSAVTQRTSVVITVGNSGIGIAPESLTSIFDLSTARDRAAASLDGGIGVGLAVVSELIAAHDGTVIGRSAGKDLGSEFVVNLPLRSLSAEAPREPPF
jgi:diguanylate cyclase (GGDEF)-like protein